jgi:hypothetical protein
MNKLPRLGFAIIMIAFVYLSIKLLRYDVSLNLATWTMWVVIDTSLLVAALRTSRQKHTGLPWSIIGFETGAVVITTIALVKTFSGNGEWNWGNLESFSLVCVVLALFAWQLTSMFGGVISITAAMYIAMAPTFYQMWLNPSGHDAWFWGACSLGCMLEYLGKPRTLIDRFFPFCGTIANGLATILAMRQYH